MMPKRLQAVPQPGQQAGFSLIGLLIVGTCIVLMAIVIMRVVPSVVEFMAIQKAVQRARDGATNPADVQRAFEKQATIDSITSIRPQDLEISRQGDKMMVSFAYDKKIPLFSNVSLLIEYSGTADRR